MPLTEKDQKRVLFRLQETASFPDGSPQRENYIHDAAFLADVRAYADEWRHEYECTGCNSPVCPQCGDGK
jgi:hypothetical protein